MIKLFSWLPLSFTKQTLNAPLTCKHSEPLRYYIGKLAVFRICISVSLFAIFIINVPYVNLEVLVHAHKVLSSSLLTSTPKMYNYSKIYKIKNTDPLCLTWKTSILLCWNLYLGLYIHTYIHTYIHVVLLLLKYLYVDVHVYSWKLPGFFPAFRPSTKKLSPFSFNYLLWHTNHKKLLYGWKINLRELTTPNWTQIAIC
jgi:hypothetical protein